MKITHIQFHRPLVLPLDTACTHLAIVNGYTAEKQANGVLLGAPNSTGQVVAHYYIPLSSCYLRVELDAPAIKGK